MASKAEVTRGEKVNFCPFGCSLEELDEHGYCDHLVGFTNDGAGFEPMTKDEQGRRRVQVRRDAKGQPVLESVAKTDVLVKITISSRVYRDRVEKKAS